VRLAESTFTAVATTSRHVLNQSAGLLPYILPSLAVGIPLACRSYGQVRPETFRRVCMSFDAWVVALASRHYCDSYTSSRQRRVLCLAAVA